MKKIHVRSQYHDPNELEHCSENHLFIHTTEETNDEYPYKVSIIRVSTTPRQNMYPETYTIKEEEFKTQDSITRYVNNCIEQYRNSFNQELNINFGTKGENFFNNDSEVNKNKLSKYLDNLDVEQFVEYDITDTII